MNWSSACFIVEKNFMYSLSKIACLDGAVVEMYIDVVVDIPVIFSLNFDHIHYPFSPIY